MAKSVELKPGDEFYSALGKLAAGEKGVRLKLNRAARAATAPLQSELKTAVMALSSDASGSSRGGGGAARAAHRAGRSKSGRFSGDTGLRAGIAKGIQTKITYSGPRIGVRLRADSGFLPPNQKSMVVNTNKGKVRHPVFGDRDSWVNQTFNPKGWFDHTIATKRGDVINKLDQAGRDAMRSLQ